MVCFYFFTLVVITVYILSIFGGSVESKKIIQEKENANKRKCLCCAPAAHCTVMLLTLFACICVHLRFLFPLI